MIDWLNIVATLVAAAIGGGVAVLVAQQQMRASESAEQRKRRSAAGLELVDTLDSYLHVAYRGDPLDRQRLRRRILSLTALAMPVRFDAMQTHLELVDRWWASKKRNGPPVRGAGLSATDEFFRDFKQMLFLEVFGTSVQLVPSPEPESSEPATMATSHAR